MISWTTGLRAIGAVALLVGAMLPAAAAEHEAGVQQITVRSQERGKNLEVTVWYPAQQGGEAISLGESIFFEGTQAFKDAPIAAEQFPLVLLSHGAGLAGRAQAMSWIAAPLAQSGFVVVAPTHPGNTGPDRSAAETMKLWLRPSDLSESLDAIENNSVFQTHVDFNKIGVLGLSMGGNTALSIAGVRLDPDLLASYCDTDALNPSLCEWVRLSGVDLHAMDLTAASRNNTDERIRFAMAIDPAPVDVFAVDTFPAVSIPVALVNLGKAAEIPATALASEIGRAIPGASYQVIDDASHYSMFAECKQGAAEIAAEEGIEDPICSDGSTRSRKAIHAELIDLVTATFKDALD